MSRWSSRIRQVYDPKRRRHVWRGEFAMEGRSLDSVHRLTVSGARSWIERRRKALRLDIHDRRPWGALDVCAPDLTADHYANEL